MIFSLIILAIILVYAINRFALSETGRKWHCTLEGHSIVGKRCIRCGKLFKKKLEGFVITVEDYLNVYNIAIKNGKKAGDSMEAEMREYIKGKGHIKKIEAEDMELLKANLREMGFYKLLDLGKLFRRNK